MPVASLLVITGLPFLWKLVQGLYGEWSWTSLACKFCHLPWVPYNAGTNVGEQIISKFSLANATRTGYFQYNTSLANSSSCTGTHTIVYSRINKQCVFTLRAHTYLCNLNDISLHARPSLQNWWCIYLQDVILICSLFIECVDGAGVLEWNTANDTYIALHNITGVVTGAPADDMIFVGNNAGSSATMIKPGGENIFVCLFMSYEPADTHRFTFFAQSVSHLHARLPEKGSLLCRTPMPTLPLCLLVPAFAFENLPWYLSIVGELSPFDLESGLLRKLDWCSQWAALRSLCGAYSGL